MAAFGSVRTSVVDRIITPFRISARLYRPIAYMTSGAPILLPRPCPSREKALLQER